MAAITTYAFIVFNVCAFINEADRFRRTTFNTSAAGDAPLPDNPGTDSKSIFEHGFEDPLIPWHRFQAEITG